MGQKNNHTWCRRDCTPSLWHCAEQQPHAGKTARLLSDAVQSSHHISDSHETLRLPYGTMHNSINRR